MDIWLEGVRRILARTPAGVLPFSEILETLSMEAPGPLPDPRWLLAALGERSEVFRIVSLARGPWGYWREAVRVGGNPLRSRRQKDDPWILLLPTPRPGMGSGERVAQRIREGLAAWGRALDDSVPSSAARWARAILEGDRVGKLLLSPGTWRA